MLPKDLTQNLYKVPALAEHYSKAHRKVFGRSIFIHQKLYGKFSVFEDDLRELHINPRDYAYVVIKMLKSWAASKKLNVIPVPVFCGNWALNKYLKVKKSESVVIQTDEDESFTILLYSELMVLRTYIADNLIKPDPGSYATIVRQLTPMLHKDWLHLYNSSIKPIGVREILCNTALEILCHDYGVPITHSYEELLDSIKAKMQ